MFSNIVNGLACMEMERFPDDFVRIASINHHQFVKQVIVNHVNQELNLHKSTLLYWHLFWNQ